MRNRLAGMMRRFGSGLLVATVLALPVHAQATPETNTELTSAQRALIDQARYWLDRGRGDLAERPLQRLLDTDPGNPEALLQYGLLEVARGEEAAARDRLQELRAQHPADTARIRRLELAIAAGTIEDPLIQEARERAAAGQYQEAARAYREAFDDEPPTDELALEYYQTLGGFAGGRSEAIEGLRELAERTGEPEARLALARTMTYAEGQPRRDGIRMLEELSRNVVVGDQAIEHWREALTWLGPAPGARPLFERYLDTFPGDQEIVALMDDAQRAAAAARAVDAPPDPATRARIRGFELLGEDDLRGAEERFRAVLGRRPNDRDALGGLGTIRLRQEEFREARDLLGRAVRDSAPAMRRWGEAYRSAYFWAGMQDADAALAAGETERAETILRDLVDRDMVEPQLARVRLGDVLLERDRLDEAERQYEAALDIEPDMLDAQAGLFNVYSAQGRLREALALADSLAPPDRRAIEGYDAVRARVLRIQARELAALGQADRAYDLLQEALAANPDDPWVRLELARLLVRFGQVEEAHTLIDPIMTDPAPTVEQLQAAAIFYNELEMYADALHAIEQVPRPAMRGPILDLRNDVLLRAEIARAQALAEAGRGREAERVLDALSREVPQTPQNVAAIAGALGDLGRYHDALRMVRRNVAGSREADSVDAYLSYLDVLVQAGHEAEAAAIMRQLSRRDGLTRSQAGRLRDLEVGLAVQQADRMRQTGDFADAYDVLYPHLAESPENPELLLALARLYASADHPREAQIIYATVLEDDPANLSAIRGAVGAAIEAKDTRTASAILDEGLRYHPHEPWLYYLVGELAKLSGDTRTAVQALETAQALRREQLESRAAAVPPVVEPLPPNPFAGRTGSPRGSSTPRVSPGMPAVPPLDDRPNPFTSSAADEPITGGASDDELLGGAGSDDLTRSARGARNITHGHDSFQIAQSPQDVYIPPFIDPAMRRRGERDDLSREIERSLSDVRRTTASYFQGQLNLRARDGEGGLDRLTGITAPMTVSFSPAEFGTIRLEAVPTFLSAGSITSDVSTLSRFGTNAVTATPPDRGDVSASGIAFGAAFAIDDFDIDVGATPVGFTIVNFVGGLSFSPRLSENVGLSATIERRAVTDSVLSYAGVKDSRTSQEWGGVTRTGGRLDIDFEFGRTGAYVGGGAYVYEGTGVESNTMVEGTVGGFYRVIDRPDQELKIGANFTFFSFEDNRRHFTLGHGGYFSPQNYAAFSVPVEYVKEVGPYSLLLGGAVGIQHFSSDRVAYFPNNPGLQSAAQAIAATNASIEAFHDSDSETGLGFNLHGQLEYDIDDDLKIGAGASFDSAADWFEGGAMIYLRRALGNL